MFFFLHHICPCEFLSPANVQSEAIFLFLLFFMSKLGLFTHIGQDPTQLDRDRFSRIQQLSYSIEIISKGFRIFYVVQVNYPKNISTSYNLDISDIYKTIKLNRFMGILLDQCHFQSLWT